MRTTQEVIAEQQAINRKLQAMNHREHGEHHTVIMGALACLADADGETLENVIELLGMREQMLRQLVMGAAIIEVETLIEEKFNNQ